MVPALPGPRASPCIRFAGRTQRDGRIPEPNPPVSESPSNSAAPDGRTHGEQLHGHEKQTTAALTLGALGVVFGDIGTSPLYALRETVLATGGAVPKPFAIYGSLSLIFWSILIVVSVKYVLLIMRADNDGEGGVLALAALAHRSPGIGRKAKNAIGFAALIGLALFFGDGVLTPAISVLSAVEGLAIGSRSFEPLVLPLTIGILLGLFAWQSHGTARIGRIFGPIMVVWFLVLGLMGLISILHVPKILAALSPHYAVALFIDEPWTAFTGLGAVVLAVTGCEALYGDMGHFGRRPIRLAWFGVVLPSLLLNYFGQGAALLLEPNKADIAFYSIAPDWLHFPLVVLATMAGVIASQAVISGVYSVTRQAVQLGRLPRMEIRHTSMTEYGQIYVPRINAMMCIGVILIVLIFKSSGALASAYGIAVTGVMLIDTFNASIVASRLWKWGRWALIAFGLLALVDIGFFAANSLKIPEGGWLPILIATAVFIVMETWRIGRRAHIERIRTESMPLPLFLERADKTPQRVAGTAVFLAARSDVVPGALLHNLKHNKVLHERVILAHVSVEDTPIVPRDSRIAVEKLGKGFFRINIHHGFFETPDVPKSLEEARPFGLALDVETTTFFIGHETLVPAENPALGRWRTWVYTHLVESALSPAKFYHLPPGRVVELGTQVSI
ncbi:MAG: potassium transporter Kup [Alphaproteobacteria bacterium]|nr:potassium transporter Kup [Alphaproteobacteria bacterium]